MSRVRLTSRQWARLVWHTRPGHAGALVLVETGLFCACGAELSR